MFTGKLVGIYTTPEPGRPLEANAELQAIEGVPLHHLIGRTFRVGDVVLRGIKSCGTLRIGDEITPVPG